MLCLHAVTDEGRNPLEDDDESGIRLRTFGVRSSSHAPRANGTPHETILEFVQKAPEDNQWDIDKREFDEMIATKKESAPGPDGIPYSIDRCAGGLRSHSLFNAYESVLEGGAVPTQFAASRTVFIPKSSNVDDKGLIVRSPHALLPLTLCKCEWKIIAAAICFVLHRYSMRRIHPAQRCDSTRQMTDNIFEVETTALRILHAQHVILAFS